MKWLRIFFTGMMISFLGTLPLGTLNISAMQISVSDGVPPALWFVAGAMLVEIIYVRISLVAMDLVFRNKKLFRWLEWIALAVIVALAVFSFAAAGNPEVKQNVLLSGTIHRFWLGVMMSAINPVQIPFWFGWSTMLFSKNILQHNNTSYNSYIAGIGCGTFAGNMVFIAGGRILVEKLNTSHHLLQLIIGGVFALTALIMLWRILTKKTSIDPAHRD